MSEAHVQRKFLLGVIQAASYKMRFKDINKDKGKNFRRRPIEFWEDCSIE